MMHVREPAAVPTVKAESAPQASARTGLLAKERAKLYATLAAIPDAVLTLNAEGRVEFLNAAAEALTGVGLDRARTLHAHSVVHLFDENGRTIVLPAHHDEVSKRYGSGHLRTHAGTIDVEYVASRIETEPPGTLIMLRDITQEHRLALRLSFEALHDPLTGLPNRRAVLEQIDEAISGARDRGEHHALAFLDLDNFKAVNDGFGHVAGDRVLADLARVMGRAVRSVDVIARLGGDEFVVLLNNCRMSDAQAVTDKVRDAVSAHEVAENGVVIPIGVSIGIAPIEQTTRSAAAVLAAADAACYQQKFDRNVRRTTRERDRNDRR